MKPLIIGGGGFLGLHLYKILEGEAIIFDLPHVCCRLEPHPCYSTNLDGFIDAADRVYNFAGILGTSSTFEHIELTIETNITLAVRVMKKCKEAGKTLINIGIGRDWWLSPYAITKRCMRSFAQMYYKEGLKGCTLIPYNAYGPGQKYSQVAKLVPTTIYNIMNNIPVPIYGGNQVVDMVYAVDIAKYITELRRFEGQEIEIGSGVPIKVTSVVDMICRKMRKLGFKPEVEFLPTRRGEDDSEQSVSSHPISMIDLSEGLDLTIDWFLNATDKERIA